MADLNDKLTTVSNNLNDLEDQIASKQTEIEETEEELAEAKETEEVHLHWQLWDGPCLTVEGVRQEDKNDAKPERVFAVQVQF